MSFSSSFFSWRNMQTAMEIERQRIAVLNQPPPRNPPELFAPVQVRAIRPFYLDRRLIEIGEVISIPKNLAESLQGIKVEII